MGTNINKIKKYLSLINEELDSREDSTAKTQETSRFIKNFKELGASVAQSRVELKNLKRRVDKIEKELSVIIKEKKDDSEGTESQKDEEDSYEDEGDEDEARRTAVKYIKSSNVLRMERVKTNDGKTVKIFVVKEKKPGRRLKGEIFAKANEVENIKQLIQEGRYDINTGKFSGGVRIRTILQRMDRRSEGKIRIRKEQESEDIDIEKEAEEEIEKELAELRKKRMREAKEKMKKKKEKTSEDIIEEEIEVAEPKKKKGKKKKEV